MTDIDREEWWQDFVDTVRRHTLTEMVDSAVVLSIAPEEPDIKYAVELGLAIMLDKPLIIVAMPGREIPEHLFRVADEVVFADLDLEEGRERVQTALRRMGVTDDEGDSE